MTAAMLDTHVQISQALSKAMTLSTGPRQHDSLTSISDSSAADDAVPGTSKRSSRSQVSWSDASPVRHAAEPTLSRLLDSIILLQLRSITGLKYPIPASLITFAASTPWSLPDAIMFYATMYWVSLHGVCRLVYFAS